VLGPKRVSDKIVLKPGARKRDRKEMDYRWM